MTVEVYTAILSELRKLDLLARQSITNEEPVDLIAFTRSLDSVTEILKAEVN